MKRYFVILSVLILSSCQLFESENRVYTLEELELLYAEIKQTAESETCNNSNDWGYVALGSKPCGGPWEYIAYSKKINVDDFLKKVKQYNHLQAEDNKKNNRFSDCMFVGEPKGVRCENGKPILIYQN
ncbi:MAG TPA: hypothetical protein DEQ87_17915 [Algoriphagus sp.]|jgi:hypothetical protein|uniref:hypothetical protein n=1 Tax=Algoriphagus TaxID=246875 RepID=UPI000C3C31B1|nr:MULTISPECIES: hypothetical protein [Algoriphagus]MAL13833.1 hypothetical protein [Algoriphagus sp.]MAN87522.1 hypothetical protein [Algoriphagus sp.]HAD52673.1 hypothetical protein [Algoriphagus sp.]HAH37089.1 hypothetical protein [Algoriphagus sp.]HAS58550.1 hypothetical protein [Algoriphagus sp.]|tara:strand:+ start:1192 stop:1575 length:384 start_codon:yes stop_codon:yes gene_type:complete